MASAKSRAPGAGRTSGRRCGRRQGDRAARGRRAEGLHRSRDARRRSRGTGFSRLSRERGGPAVTPRGPQSPVIAEEHIRFPRAVAPSGERRTRRRRIRVRQDTISRDSSAPESAPDRARCRNSRPAAPTSSCQPAAAAPSCSMGCESCLGHEVLSSSATCDSLLAGVIGIKPAALTWGSAVTVPSSQASRVFASVAAAAFGREQGELGNATTHCDFKNVFGRLLTAEGRSQRDAGHLEARSSSSTSLRRADSPANTL
jgi:hypothetical protein